MNAQRFDARADAAETPATPLAPPAAVATSGTRLQRMRWPLLALAPVLVVLIGGYFYLTAGRYQSTDDAYTQAATVAISANVAGRISEVDVRDNQHVTRGQLLYRLDDAPYQIAVREAAARLASVRLEIESLKSTWRQRQVDLRAALDTEAFEQREFDRETRLLKSGIASQVQLDQAAHALDVARQQVASARQQIDVALANLGGDPNLPPDRHPRVAQAAAVLAQAELELSYAAVHAPQDGIVTKVEQLQVGDYVAASTPTFALVSTRDVWIEANFKEIQLARMRPGDRATVKIDRFPGRTFEAKVASVSPSTGSQFSLLPPENATGNWVKVVQRVPVRLELVGADLPEPLAAGLSADVTVDTRGRAARPDAARVADSR
jgi:membrane fusion protein (multidrug efflux system)